jgi:hypothetical protein
MITVEISKAGENITSGSTCQFHARYKVLWQVQFNGETHYACANNSCIANWVKELLGGTE